MVQVRYIVRDVDSSVEFYVAHLGFGLQAQYGPAMAIVTRGDLQLWLAGPPASASKPMPDGTQPVPGGRQILCMDPSGNVVELFQPT